MTGIGAGVKSGIFRAALALAAALALVVPQLRAEPGALPACAPSPATQGWELSFHSACRDAKGALAGGSEIIHLVGHKGALYAANGYWMDPRNPIYGGTSKDSGWAQILRLDAPTGRWQVDLELGPRHLRAEILQSVEFATDGAGAKLSPPVRLLMASTFDAGGSDGISLFVRDDASGQWARSKIIAGATGKSGEDNSVRAILVHRDRVTGIDRIFISIGMLGIFSGVYDEAASGKIRWDAKAEFGPLPVRALAIIEADGALLFSAGRRIYRRSDGPLPTYAVVHEMDEQSGGAVLSPVGGIRGLTAIAPAQGAAGPSLIFAWNPGARSRACVFRLDADGAGGFTRHPEACLGDLVSTYLGSNPVFFVLAGYNNFLAITDPSSGQTLHLIGLEAWIGGNRHPTAQRKEGGGYYAGALYAVRDAKGNYRLGEINGPIGAGQKPLVSARSYALSPFAQDRGQAVYFGGYDANFVRAEDAAWIFRTTPANALRKQPARP